MPKQTGKKRTTGRSQPYSSTKSRRSTQKTVQQNAALASKIAALKANDKYEVSEAFLRECGDAFKEVRGFAVDGMVSACSGLGVTREGLHVAVRLFDYCALNVWEERENRNDLMRHNLVAVGYACVSIASKFVDKKPVKAADLAGLINQSPLRDGTYSVAHILKLETHILTTVSMDLPDTTVCAFADRFATAGGIATNSREHAFVHFVLELALTDYTFCKYKASLMAAAAVYMTRKTFLTGAGMPREGENSWPDTLAAVTGIEKKKNWLFFECAQRMADVLRSFCRPERAVGKHDALAAKWKQPGFFSLGAFLYD
ncbi:unnamed protein product [Vitrella brassicaformis CCMP3155]|uniref:Cyclin C-terminal domain-containing protein n=1 Tax=Vitrella brassicaformis (strain CCMP3155) TaxID=1169540 RepID=A0A0G4GWE4_VITBC|nr:unnamed protein product [Vitrella brassicaformis CCMP3155]|eukprot:CEM35301.1 unnamed protein product [Vitrella brassicaformis CCMP3155]